MPEPQTTAVRLTPKGRGAVAAISVQGSISEIDIPFQAVNGRTLSQQSVDRICYGLWGREHPEDVVIVKLHEQAFEIHCHGGTAAVERILSDLADAGATVQTSTNKRSEHSIEEEILNCLQRATTQRTAHLLLRQSTLFPTEWERINNLEHELKSESITKMLHWAEFGKHLVTPWQVVLCGSPNVGKSSLINALVGYSRSVVFDQPGTTRDVVSVQTALEGWPIEFSDTAGLRETSESLESLGIEKAKAKIKDANLLIVVVDARELVSEFEDSLQKSHRNSMLVVNKIDLVKEQHFRQAAIPVSAVNGTGIDDLAKQVVKKLVPELPPESQAYPVTERQVEWLQAIDQDQLVK